MLTADVVKVQSVQLVWYDLPDAGSSRSSVHCTECTVWFGMAYSWFGMAYLVLTAGVVVYRVYSWFGMVYLVLAAGMVVYSLVWYG